VNIDKIKKPIEDELGLFEEKFRASMKTKVALLDRIMHYIVQRKGKQMRPMFVFLTAKMFGEVKDSTYTAASMIELLHTATLVHDDVVDDAHERRGFFSINALWKNKIAVLVGDFLLSKGLLIAVENDEFDLLKIMSKSVRDMSEGELLQIEKARKLDIEEAVYYEIIRKKTASLIATACAAGVSSSKAGEEWVQKAHRLGEMIGMAFQIKDDLFDYGEEEIGKPRGIDIKERKMTLPIIYTLTHSNSSVKSFITNTIKNDNTNQKKVKEVIRLVHEYGGIDYTIQKMNELKDKSIALLQEFPDNESRQSLLEIIHYTIERKN
jgi:octaprenyl-diphosphate synthase